MRVSGHYWFSFFSEIGGHWRTGGHSSNTVSDTTGFPLPPAHRRLPPGFSGSFPQNCLICSMPFHDEASLSNHMAAAHRDEHFTFTQRGHHRRDGNFPPTHHQQRLDRNVPLNAPKTDGNFPYVCNVCGKGYNVANSLYYHQRSHSDVGHRCPLCETSFTRRFSLKLHLKKCHHSAQCQACSAVLKLGHEFSSHVCSSGPM